MVLASALAGCASFDDGSVPGPKAYDRTVTGLFNATERTFIVPPRYDGSSTKEYEARIFFIGINSDGVRIFRVDEDHRAAPAHDEGIPVSGSDFLIFARGTVDDLKAVRFGIRNRAGETLLDAVAEDEPKRFGFSSFLVKRKERTGIFDAAARRWASAVDYDEVKSFDTTNEYAIMRRGDLFGVVAAGGAETLPAKYDEIDDTAGGYVVAVANGKPGLYTFDGREVVPHRYDLLLPSPPGLIWFGYQDPPEKPAAGAPKPKPPAATERNRRLGLMRSDGTVLVEPRFEAITRFSRGVAAVKLGGKWGYVDATGAFVREPEFDNASPFVGNAAFVARGKQWGAVDRDFKPLIPFAYDALRLVRAEQGSLFSSRDIVTAKAAERFDFFDPAGTKLGSVQADGIGGCELEKAACVFHRGDKRGLVHVSGKILVAPEFDAVNVLARQGVVIVKRGATFGVLSYPDGKQLQEPRYRAVDFADLAPELLLVDASGVQLYDPRAGKSRRLPSGVARAAYAAHERLLVVTTRVGAKGLMDLEGNWLLAPQAQNVRHVTDALFEVERQAPPAP